MNALIYVDIDQDIYKVKPKVALNEKWKKKLRDQATFFMN